MKIMRIIFLLFFVSFVAGQATEAQAASFSASSSQAGETMRYTPEQVVRFAKKVEKVLASKGAHVAILARKGRPQSEMPEGMAS